MKLDNHAKGVPSKIFLIKLNNKVLENTKIKGLRSKADKSIHFVVTPIIKTIDVTTGKIKDGK